MTASVTHKDDSEKPGFTRFASATASWSGKPAVFLTAVALVVAWAVTGPLFNYSTTWQLVINTSTTIVTFLMVFLIQNTQNRDSYAVQLKLDELIRSTEGAHTELLDIESLSAERLEELRDLYTELAGKARERAVTGGDDTDCPSIDLHAPHDRGKPESSLATP